MAPCLVLALLLAVLAIELQGVFWADETARLTSEWSTLEVEHRTLSKDLWSYTTQKCPPLSTYTIPQLHI